MHAFNEVTRKDMFTESLPFLDSTEVFLFMVFFYNALVQFLKYHYNDNCLEMSVYHVQKI